jgi:hypothetical protein
MESFDLQNFKTINTIIERDSKDTTYKYALLRGAVEISQEYQHLKHERGNRIEFPLGLLIEKWLLYYYPFIESDIPQKSGEDKEAAKQISFRRTFKKITDFYAVNGKFSEFYKDYTKGSIPSSIVPEFRSLVREIRNTITKYPMKHLGYSATKEYYSVFDFDRQFVMPTGNFPVERDYLIRNMGTYSLSREFDTIFEILGSFISGEDAVLFQWAEFTRSASNGNVSLAGALEKLRTWPITERDKIPSPEFIEKRKSALKHYWNLLQKDHPRKFDRELAISLTGVIDPASDWQEIAVQKLIEKCRYYIDVRGFDVWSLP